MCKAWNFSADSLKHLDKFLIVYLGVVVDPDPEVGFNCVYQELGTAIGVRVAYFIAPYHGLTVLYPGEIRLGVTHYRGQSQALVNIVY